MSDLLEDLRELGFVPNPPTLNGLPTELVKLDLTGVEYIFEDDPSFFREVNHPSFDVGDLVGKLRAHQQKMEWQKQLFGDRIGGAPSRLSDHFRTLLGLMPKMTDIHIRSKYPGGSLIHESMDHRTSLYADLHLYRRGIPAMLSLFLACAEKEKKITTLAINKVADLFFFTCTAEPKCVELTKKIDKATADLDSISLEITAKERGWSPENGYGIREFRPTFLMIPHGIPTIFPGVFRSMFGRNIWPKLGEFSIGYLEAEEGTLISFISDHKNTLKILSLETIMLSAGSWASLLPRLQAIISSSDFKLDTITVRGHLLEQINNPRTCFEEIICDNSEDFQPIRVKAQQNQVEAYLKDRGFCPITMNNTRCTPRRYQPLFPVIF
ncbi:uncharacterized protein BDZ99DRAFT_527312 [Mytilinidion resinicola]|uniref:Uncharacterized protein n=1 Tax=Mytilinidion resinicola TaxID=574789 RepID=A0A6A6Y3I4_9PEZI|nr:uncharacterized protein BDZ99DRAFT_527312 [Mytilinidion resinicola]KAF2802584.1 hypothetical protein BDZ99DRAFT_527312 [Mytilinidion resinicola]